LTRLVSKIALLMILMIVGPRMGRGHTVESLAPGIAVQGTGSICMFYRLAHVIGGDVEQSSLLIKLCSVRIRRHITLLQAQSLNCGSSPETLVAFSIMWCAIAFLLSDSEESLRWSTEVLQFCNRLRHTQQYCTYVTYVSIRLLNNSRCWSSTSCFSKTRLPF